MFDPDVSDDEPNVDTFRYLAGQDPPINRINDTSLSGLDDTLRLCPNARFKERPHDVLKYPWTSSLGLRNFAYRPVNCYCLRTGQNGLVKGLTSLNHSSNRPQPNALKLACRSTAKKTQLPAISPARPRKTFQHIQGCRVESVLKVRKP